ncbi:TPA: hypothetical protein MHU07_25445 [Klebsiella pneumoniae]|nr:hypothetical protein [Klebsiella pneumoniae]
MRDRENLFSIYQINQQSTINNQQSTINNQQSTINNQQSTINNQQSNQCTISQSAEWCFYLL